MAARDRASGRNEARDDGVPALAARPGGLADRFAGRVGRQHPVTVFFAALISGFALLAAVAILLGLLVTDVLVPIHAVGSADEGFVESLVADRTPVLTDVSAVGTAAGGAPVLPILAGLIAIVCALMRRWLIAGFAAFVLTVESATYRVSSLVVPRERPSVHRLEDLPGRRELSVRPHRSLDRGVCRPRAAAHVEDHRSQSEDRRVGARRAVARPRRHVAHVPRDAPSARCGQRGGHRDRRDHGAPLRLSRGELRAAISGRGAHAGASRPSADRVMRVAVVAHAGKDLGGGLPELRRVLESEGVETPLWYEVPKAKKAPAQVERALEEGAELVFAWGGDGMVRRCVGVMAGGDAKLAVLPAGTSNLFATNMGIPKDIKAAVAIGLRGTTRRLDVGRFKSERFAVMAGAGFDAGMIRDADNLKERLGRAAYVWSGARNLRTEGFGARIEVDGAEWYDGQATCILVGNLGSLFGGVEVFPDARPDDGQLELGVVEGAGLVRWMRILARTAVGDPSASPFVRVTRANAIKAKLDRKVLYELDGGERSEIKSFKVRVEPGALRVRVPRRGQEES